MLKEALRHGIIARDPSAFANGLAERPRERGLLTADEIRPLFDERTTRRVRGDDRLHYTLNMLAASTAVRAGEMQALTVGAVHPDHVSVTRAGSGAAAGARAPGPDAGGSHLYPRRSRPI